MDLFNDTKKVIIAGSRSFADYDKLEVVVISV